MFALRHLSLLLTLALAASIPGRAETLRPTDVDAEVARRVVQLLEERHLSGDRLDDMKSRQFLENYLSLLDPDRMYFLASDVREFRAKQDTLDDALRTGDVQIGFDIYQRLLERIDQQLASLATQLEGLQDLAAEEYAPRRGGQLRFARDTESMKQRWRLRSKLDMLAEIIGKEKSPEDAQAAVLRQHENRARRIRARSRSEVLELFLTAAATTYDEYTAYLSAASVADLRTNLRLQLQGIGAVLAAEDGHTVVRALVPGGAAFRDGRLKPKDIILAVGEGEDGAPASIENQSLQSTVGRIRGREGTAVKLVVRRAADKSEETILLKRSRIQLNDRKAYGEVLRVAASGNDPERNIGFVELPTFYRDRQPGGNKTQTLQTPTVRSSTRDVRNILTRFHKQKVDALIVDLRKNSGGLLTEALGVTGLFIDNGPLLQIQGAGGRIEEKADPSPGAVWDGPLVILTSKITASASEIFAGAIQDYRRGLVVGDVSTHGKGTVQSLVDLGTLRRHNDTIKLGAIKVTVSQFFLPSGRSTQHIGIRPDIELPSLTSYLGATHHQSPASYWPEYIAPMAYQPAASGVTANVIDELTERSEKRREMSEAFHQIEDDVHQLLRRNALQWIPLRQEKYQALFGNESAFAKANAKAKIATPWGKREIVRDAYVEEVLRITADLVRALGE